MLAATRLIIAQQLGCGAPSAILAGLSGLDDFYYLVLASRAFASPHIVALLPTYATLAWVVGLLIVYLR